MRFVHPDRSRHGQRRRWHNPGPVLDIEAAIVEIKDWLVSRLRHLPDAPALYIDVAKSDAITEYIRERLVAHNATAHVSPDDTLTFNLPPKTTITETESITPVSLADNAKEAIKTFNDIVRTHKRNRQAAAPSIVSFFHGQLYQVVMTAVSAYRVPPQNYDMVSYLVELVLQRSSRDALLLFEKWGNTIAKFLKTCSTWQPLQGIQGRNFVVVPQLALPPKAIEMITQAVMHCEHTLLATGGIESKIAPVVRMEELVYGPVLISYDVVPGAAAFYLISEDFLVIQSQARTMHVNMLTHATFHELGHRYWKLFADAPRKLMWSAYHLKCLQVARSRERLKVGTIIYDSNYWLRGGNELLKIDHFDSSVCCFGMGAKKSFVTMPHETAAIRTAFPTNYAATNEEEHFCETFAIYLGGNLIEPFLSNFIHIWTEAVQ